MLKGESKKAKKEPVILERGGFLYARRGGFFQLSVKPGTLVDEGEILGTITNIKNEIVETIRAPAKGVILCAQANPAKNVGDKLILWGNV
jgi:predicted deacylase